MDKIRFMGLEPKVLLEVQAQRVNGSWETIAYVSSPYSASRACTVRAHHNKVVGFKTDDIGILEHKVFDPNLAIQRSM